MSHMRRAPGISDSDWKGGFLFVGNQLALDFVNTCPMLGDEPVELLPDFHALLRWFEAAGVLDRRTVAKLAAKWGRSSQAQHTVTVMRDWRERLRSQILSWESGKNLQPGMQKELNRLLSQHPMLARLSKSENGPITELWFDPQKPDELFAPLAQSAATLFSNVDRNRVRMCSNCVLHFYDTSKKGTRHWCSMRLCGNRLKVAAYAQRKRNSG